MDCLWKSLKKCRGGTWLAQYSLVVLEHGVMDKKCAVCRRHRVRKLEKALNGKRKKQQKLPQDTLEVSLNVLGRDGSLTSDKGPFFMFFFTLGLCIR